jgi:hypothetical protein
MNSLRLIGFILLAAAGGCANSPPDIAATTTETTMAPEQITVSDATEENSRLVALAAGDALNTTDFRDDAQIGCRTNPESLMSEGPPWRVRSTWVLDNPPAEFVTAALARLDTLTGQGFQRQPWTRPDPEPPNRRSYEDVRGYRVAAGTDERPGNVMVFELTVTSPCANP